ncbi:MAG: DUF2851 family protein [Candidatus Marinimicrobia bacterium]|nr:DUF2851 family protein [Candidatus Neomarinimicrobiota bacterium]MBL7010158.1 DUF2851 family protein [Candidatus Neomarinimicrobiota bacterium]MBL7030423.1 DUF2851 family protein [Candidatus Neomarinimicrobiota bacterium]
MQPNIFYQKPVRIPVQPLQISDAPILEKELLRTWLNVKPGTIINDLKGNSIMVIQTGYPNPNEGPDIRKAVLFKDGKFVTGDIECHIRSRDWFYHGHDKDPNYRNIILHITAIPDKMDSEWKGLLIHLRPKEPTKSCQLRKHNVNQSFADTLIALGLDRRSRQVKRYQSHNWKALVLQDIFRLLGKGGNEDNFLQLLKYYQNGFVENHSIMQSIKWHHRGIRPNGWPEKRLSIASQLFKMVHSFKMHPQQIPIIPEFNNHKNLYIELVGNVLNPLSAAACLLRKEYDTYQVLKQDWLCLKLGYSYGKFEKQFSYILSKRQLKIFSILQGLFELENNFCKGYHCHVCPLKKRNGCHNSN